MRQLRFCLSLFVLFCALASTAGAGFTSGPRLETHILPGIDAGTFQVNLQQGYLSPVVVCSVVYQNNTVPVVTRIHNLTQVGFGLSLQEPGTSNQKGGLAPETVYCIVAEEGVHVVDGQTVEAHSYTSTVTDRKNSWTGTPQILAHAFTNPVVLGQVMSFNDPRFSAFWAQGSSRTVPPSPSALTTGKMVGEDPDTTRADETVGYIVFEADHGTIAGVEFETGVGPTTVQGVDNNPPYEYTFDTTFAAPPQLAVVSLAGMRGGDGGWAQLFPDSPAITATTLQLSADEDHVRDAERNHATERVAYAVFGEEFVYPPQAPTGCSVDADCDDGLWCNGAEACNFGISVGVCVSGIQECLGQLCDENADQCVTGPAMRLETVSLGSVGGSFQPVTTNHTYVEPVVVCNAEYQNNEIPIVVRLDNVQPGGFDIKLQNPSDRPVNPEEVFCLVVEAGAWEQDGVRFEAQRYTSSVTDRKGAWIGQSQGYLHNYASPVVVGQVMSHNDPDFSVYWQQGALRTSPPTASTLINGKTVLEDPDTTRADETVGFIVFEAGHGTFLTTNYEAATGPDTVQSPWNSPPFIYTFLQPFATAPLFAVTSMAGVDGGDGAWSQLHPASPPTTPTTLSLSVDEDQVKDVERSHASEQVNYIVFEDNVAFPPVDDCVDDSDCPGFATFCDGVDHCQAGACVNDGPPCGVGETCDEQGEVCETETERLETVVVPQVGDVGMGTPVTFTNAYTDPVVVCTIQYVANSVPVVPRVFGVHANGFSVGTQNPGDGPHAPDTVHCLVVEQGVWMIDGNMIEARKYTSTVTDNDPSWLGTAQTLSHPFTDPVIVGQVMSDADPDFSVYWQQGASRGLPPSSTALRNGKTVLEDFDTVRDDEVIGYIAFEKGCGTLGGVPFEAFLTADFVQGIDNGPPFTHPLTCFDPPKGPGSPMVGVLSTAGMDGIDGAWPYLYGPNALRPTEVDLAVDEDQLENDERSHTTEQIMGIVFETDVVAGPPACTVSGGGKASRVVDPACDGPCDAQDEAGSPDCDGVCHVDDAEEGPDCNALCEDGETGSGDCNGICEPGEDQDDFLDFENHPDCNAICEAGETGSGDCNNICEPGDGFPDCDGICDGNLEAGSNDCDNVCGPGDVFPDCDGICDPGETPPPQKGADVEKGVPASYPDCNETCDSSEVAESVDCDEACQAGDSADGPDCNQACDQPGDAGGPDCNGTCEAGDTGAVDCNGTCEAGEEGSIDCSGACDQPSDVGGPDCNGACDQPGEEDGPDCNGVCDHPDDLFPDCNGLCDQPGDTFADCDDICDPGEFGVPDKASGVEKGIPSFPDCNGACDQPGEDPGPDCNAACDQLGEDPGPDCNGACDQAGEDSGSDCNGACDQLGEDPGPDCNGACDEAGEEGFADCDGTCDPGDLTPDCDGFCDPGEAGGGAKSRTSVADVAFGFPDCDGFCGPGDTGAADCNGVCDPGDSDATECDGFCDPDDTGEADCDGTCVAGEEGSIDCNGACDQLGEDPGPDCNGACDQAGEDSGPDCNDKCDQAGEDPGPDCNGACDQAGEDPGPDCNGACDQPGEDPGPDCNGACDQAGEDPGPDCNGVCDQAGEDPGPDCNGVCDQPGDIGGPDCNDICEPGDGFPDCDGFCDPGEVGGGAKSRTSVALGFPDCDGVCDPGDTDATECNGFCDPGDTGPLDCNGVCDPGDTNPADCNGMCDSPNEAFPDCDFVCGPGDTSMPDCNGVCDPGDTNPADCNGMCDSPNEAFPDCDFVCGPGDTSMPDCNGVCDPGDTNPADCNGLCDSPNEAFPDCDLMCGPGDTSMPDCNGVCDPGDTNPADCNGLCDSPNEAFPDCDFVCGPGDTSMPDCNGVCDPGDTNPADCNGVCDSPNEAFPDCDLVCGPGDTSMPDCNGVCDPGDTNPADCNGMCDAPNEAPPDCDGFCGPGDTSLPDCNGVCDTEMGLPDCNGFCDPGEDMGPDCNGVCESGDTSMSDCNGMCDSPAECDTNDCVKKNGNEKGGDFDCSGA